MERAMETQRLRLLRFVAGLLAAVSFVLAVPFSSAFSRWVGEGVSSVLSRAELAAQCLVIVQARLIAANAGRDVDFQHVLDLHIRKSAENENPVSLIDLRGRLETLRALLEDLPRFGLRLLRQIEKRARRLSGALREHRVAPHQDRHEVTALCAWRLARIRIERPPDKDSLRVRVYTPSPRQRAGVENGCVAA